MEQVIDTLLSRYPGLAFKEGPLFFWSPETQEIFFNSRKQAEESIWSLLHETGHALLKHSTYKADFELIKLEVAAWEKARELAAELGLSIDEDHIQDCLDTYRDWLHRRSACPTCNSISLQLSGSLYECYNCGTNWQVTAARFCRAYRSTKHLKKPPVVFHATNGF